MQPRPSTCQSSACHFSAIPVSVVSPWLHSSRLSLLKADSIDNLAQNVPTIVTNCTTMAGLQKDDKVPDFQPGLKIFNANDHFLDHADPPV